MSRKPYFIGDAPVLKVSALTGKGVHKLRPILHETIIQYHKRVPTTDVNRVIAEAQQKQPAGSGARVLCAAGWPTRRRLRFLPIGNYRKTYLRHLERCIREKAPILIYTDKNSCA